MGLIKEKITSKKSISIYDLALGLSLFTNGWCVYHTRRKSDQIIKLIEKNELLADSADKLNSDLLRMGDEIALINANTPRSVQTLFIKSLVRFIEEFAVSSPVTWTPVDVSAVEPTPGGQTAGIPGVGNLVAESVAGNLAVESVVNTAANLPSIF